jgi:2Fe-2S ferredoxin
MGTVTYVEHGGAEHRIELDDDISVMEGAIRNGVPGIDADCGGMCACATCHVHVAPEWLELTGPPGPQEEELLDLAPERDAYSRLSCQIAMTPALDGLVVRLPESQH